MDSNDNTYKFNVSDKKVEALNIKLFDYILKRFREEEDI